MERESSPASRYAMRASQSMNALPKLRKGSPRPLHMNILLEREELNPGKKSEANQKALPVLPRLRGGNLRGKEAFVAAAPTRNSGGKIGRLHLRGGDPKLNM